MKTRVIVVVLGLILTPVSACGEDGLVTIVVARLNKECTPLNPPGGGVHFTTHAKRALLCASFSAYGVSFAWQRDRGATADQVMSWAYRVEPGGGKTPIIPEPNLLQFTRLTEYVFHERNARITWLEMEGCVMAMCVLGGFDVKPETIAVPQESGPK